MEAHRAPPPEVHLSRRYEKTYSPEILLDALMSATPRRTAEAPKDTRGLYGLVDHFGDLRYIGSTSSDAETLYKRIYQRHRTGSENTSHYFSRMYNVGRMWRDRDDAATKVDGDIAKALRNAFVAEHCRAVWLPLPDSLNIAHLEAAVLNIAPAQVIAWNRRGMDVYGEPVDLVDATIQRLGLGTSELAAIERQRQRCLTSSCSAMRPAAPPARTSEPSALPHGLFRFVALDVETANYDRGSICQIGLAFVRPDNSIETWVTYVDPGTDDWSCSRIHGITGRTVRGAPRFADLLPRLDAALQGLTVYQHSSFDSTAIHAACHHAGRTAPNWIWRDSVQVARGAWPELKGNGGHGLASLKRHLGLDFKHHDAGEDSRAAAEVVLLAEVTRPISSAPRPIKLAIPSDDPEDFDLIEPTDIVAAVRPASVPVMSASAPADAKAPLLLGTTVITQANIDHNHIYLRPFFDKFPVDAIGGSNMASVARREISLDWGGMTVAMTDLDGSKRFFRKRSWVSGFFQQNGIVAGDIVTVEEMGSYSYRIRRQAG